MKQIGLRMQTAVSFDTSDWQSDFSKEQQDRAIDALEEGKLLLFPQLDFKVKNDEKHLLNPAYLAPRYKNISYNLKTGMLGGVQADPVDIKRLEIFLKRYAEHCKELLETLLPHYKDSLIQARTSFRPAAVSNRKTSYRKDDRLLHVDAFPATPNHGMRILRVFSNINPSDEPRVWHVGESYKQVAETFLPSIPKPFPGKHFFLRLFKLTKSRRSMYDHYMLHIHDYMKKDSHYQTRAIQARLELPAHSTWIVATDQVSHAALAGQYMMEQTFYLPPDAMKYPERSPLRILESLLKRSLK